MKKRFSSLSWKLFLICFAFVLSSVTLVSALSYRYVEKEISANESYYIEQILSKVDQYLTLSFTSLQTVLFSMEALAKANPDLNEPFREQLIDLYEMNFDYVTNLYFIQDDYSIVGASPITRALDRPDPYRAEIYRASLDSPLHSVVSKPYKSTFSGWTVTLSRHVSGSNPPIVAAIDLDLNRIETSLLSITQLEAMNLALIDEDGQLVAGYRGSSEPSGANSELHVLQVAGMSGAQLLQSGNTTFSLRDADRGPVTVTLKSAQKFNWLIVAMTSDARIVKSLNKMEGSYVGLIAIGAALSLIVAALITRYIRKPLGSLIRKMNRINEGHLIVEESLRRNDEFGELAKTFDTTIGTIMKLIDDLNINKELQRKLEIQMLQSQINPHFLYNTLGSISNVVHLGQLDKVDPVIRSLIAILEYGIKDSSEKVTLRDELRNVRDYLQIQNIRYNKQFEWVEAIGPEHGNYPVFRMMLQPIVENSIFHGYEGGTISGPIYLATYEENRRFIVEVRDAGVGMPQPIVDRLLTAQSDESRPGRKRIGLYNIHARIRLQYGEPYGIRVSSTEGAGTTVRLELPIQACGSE